MEWRVAPATVLTVGMRGENRSADYQDTDGAAFSPDETMYGGSVSLRRDSRRRTQGYVKFARGYKAGGFNIGSQVPAGQAQLRCRDPAQFRARPASVEARCRARRRPRALLHAPLRPAGAGR